MHMKWGSCLVEALAHFSTQHTDYLQRQCCAGVFGLVSTPALLAVSLSTHARNGGSG